MSVSIIKLVSEEEIVGEIVSDQEEVVVVKNPLKLTLMRDPATGQPAKGFIDYFLSQEVNHVSFYRRNLMCAPVEANKELADVWMQQTSSIVLAPTGKIQLNG